MRGIFISGTDTAVGKTTIGAQIAQALRACGQRVRVRKPVQTGCGQLSSNENNQKLLDSIRLQLAAGSVDDLEVISPFRFAEPLSPERAVLPNGQVLTLGDLHAACLQGLADEDFLLVEGSGGFYAPIASNARNADLAAGIGLPVLLVVADRPGAINHALLTIEAIHLRGMALLGVVLNEVAEADAPYLDNHADLQRWVSAPIIKQGYNSPPNPQLAAWVERWIGGN